MLPKTRKIIIYQPLVKSSILFYSSLRFHSEPVLWILKKNKQIKNKTAKIHFLSMNQVFKIQSGKQTQKNTNKLELPSKKKTSWHFSGKPQQNSSSRQVERNNDHHQHNIPAKPHTNLSNLKTKTNYVSFVFFLLLLSLHTTCVLLYFEFIYILPKTNDRECLCLYLNEINEIYFYEYLLDILKTVAIQSRLDELYLTIKKKFVIS